MCPSLHSLIVRTDLSAEALRIPKSPTDLPIEFLSSSGSGHEKLLVSFLIRFVGSRRGGYVLHEFTAAVWAFVFNHTRSASGDVAGLEAEDAAVAHLYLGTKPIRAEHASCAIEGHRRRDRTFEVLFGAGEDPPAHRLRPGHSSDQGIIQAATLGRDCVREFAQLQQLQ